MLAGANRLPSRRASPIKFRVLNEYLFFTYRGHQNCGDVSGIQRWASHWKAILFSIMYMVIYTVEYRTTLRHSTALKAARLPGVGALCVSERVRSVGFC